MKLRTVRNCLDGIACFKMFQNGRVFALNSFDAIGNFDTTFIGETRLKKTSAECLRRGNLRSRIVRFECIADANQTVRGPPRRDRA